MRTRLDAYVGFGMMQARTALLFRVDYVVGLLRVLLQIFLLRVVWNALYDGRPSVGGVELSVTIAYAVLASMQNWLFNPWVFSLIPDRVREGHVGIDLIRPASFLGQVVARQVGRTAVAAPFVLIALPFAILIAEAPVPASVEAATGYVVSLALGYGIVTLLSVLVGLTAFWMIDNTGLFLIYRIAAFFLSGAVVPLWFMPDGLRTVIELLPFQATMYVPAAIYLGHISGVAGLRAMAVQVAWLVALWCAARWAWSRAIRRVVVYGG